MRLLDLCGELEAYDVVSFRCNIVDAGNEFKVRGERKTNIFNGIGTLEMVVM